MLLFKVYKNDLEYGFVDSHNDFVKELYVKLYDKITRKYDGVWIDKTMFKLTDEEYLKFFRKV